MAYAQEEDNVNLQQYLFPDFSRSVVKMKNGRTSNVMLNYNRISEKMVFEQRGEYFNLVNPETVDTIYLHNRPFIMQGKCFLEIVSEGKYPFYIQYRGELRAPPRPAAYGTTSELTSSNYLSGINTNEGYFNFKLPEGYKVINSAIYWVMIDGEMKSFIGEKQFLRLFPGEAPRLKKYIKDSKLKLDKTEDFLRLVKYCNSEL